MTTDVNNDEVADKRLCFDCVREGFLRGEIELHGKRRRCSYCGAVARSFSIGKVSDRVERAFEKHYARTADQPNGWESMLIRDKESDYEWEREGEPVVYAIMNAAEISEVAAQDIQTVLEARHESYDYTDCCEETEFSSDSYYEEKGADSSRWHMEWRKFEESLKTEARFFSRSAAHLLASVFDGIDVMKTRDGRTLVVDAGPGTAWKDLYRARAFQSENNLGNALISPDRHLGSPPSLLASAGRMNARGISVFYGANDPKVALAEVRPPVGCRVAVARFEIIRPIKLLDLTAFGGVTTTGSVFDPAFADTVERLAFLRSLSNRIVRPVMPDDEAFEYLATQAVADFLATEAASPIDGIIFPSVQAAGSALNVVLLHKAALVEDIRLPAGTTTRVSFGHSTEDGWEEDYTVYEEVQSTDQKNAPILDTRVSDDFDRTAGAPSKCHVATLRVDLQSIYIHVIQAVEFTSARLKVDRHRWEKHEPNF